MLSVQGCKRPYSAGDGPRPNTLRATRRFLTCGPGMPAAQNTRMCLMEKILIIGCKKTMDDVCIGCSRCMVAFNRRVGLFEKYDQDAELMGLLNCGDCPGASIVPRLAQVKLWNMPMEEKPTKVHIAPCIADHCPYYDDLVTKIQAKAGVEVIEGTHPYMPSDVFA